MIGSRIPSVRLGGGVAGLLLLMLAAACSDFPGPSSGALHISVTTIGVDLDADGYSVVIDGGPVSKTAIGVNDAATLPAFSGSHTVLLAGIAPNCSVAAPNPHAVEVTSSHTVEVAFAVTCVTLTGDLAVTVATTGAASAGYRLSIDGVATEQLPANAATIVTGLPRGGHVVGLGNVASGCAVTPSNPLTINVKPQATVTAAFAVSCH
jgi:hypothetical protein